MLSNLCTNYQVSSTSLGSVEAKMLSSGSNDLQKKSFHEEMKEDTKLFSRIVSKESSMANPSFRVYYGGVCGAVPFIWESQPGTPKHKLFSIDSSNCIDIPPLTPPPSYYSNNNKKPPTKKYYSRSKLIINTLFRLRINLNKSSHVPTISPSSCSSLSSSSTSWSSSSMTGSKIHGRRRNDRFLSQRSSFDDDEMGGFGSPTSTLCFGFFRENTTTTTTTTTAGGVLGGGYSVVVMKKAFLSMVGRRSSA